MYSLLSAATFQACRDLICCKTGLNVGGKTRNIAIQLVFQQFQNKMYVFLSRSTVALDQ